MPCCIAVGGSKFTQFLNHPAGPKTIFFWAPMAKWALVIAGLKDMNRPADKVSVPANLGQSLSPGVKRLV